MEPGRLKRTNERCKARQQVPAHSPGNPDGNFVGLTLLYTVMLATKRPVKDAVSVRENSMRAILVAPVKGRG